MSPAIDSTPVGTKIAILQTVAAERHPKLALPAIASRHNMTIVDLQALLHRYGYPDLAQLKRAADDLLEENAQITHAADAALAGIIPAQDAEAALREHFGLDEPTPTDPGEPVAPVGDVLIRVPMNRIHPDPDNLRENLTGIEELAESIVELGLLQPIVVRRDGRWFRIVAGHRRYAALQHLKHTDAQVIIKGAIRPEHVLAAMLVENGQRVDLDPIEEARGLAALKRQLDLSDLELGRMVGRSQPHVSSRLALLALSAEDQAAVRAGSLGVVQASHKGRMNSGKVMTPGQERDWHLGLTHDLANQVKARCVRLGHKNGRKVGGTGCGECWESVIRADERTKLLAGYHDTDNCPTCGQTAPAKVGA